MRLLFIADGRSPIALNWIAHFIKTEHEVHLLSTFPCRPNLKLSSLLVVPVAFSSARKSLRTGRTSVGGAGGIGLRAFLRHWLGPFTIPWAAVRVKKKIEALRPDLVHAMRIPFEGILATVAQPSAPLLISVWGNDFTLHAPSTPFMARLTRRVLSRADALHTDCHRDLNLARSWGFPDCMPGLVLPGGGGVRPEVFHPGKPDMVVLGGSLAAVLCDIPPGAPVVVNPRGFRAYVRNDTFFEAVPRILKGHPEAIFLCPAMAGEAQAERWIKSLGLGAAVRLLPLLSPFEMAAVYQRAQITVSPTEHDGTPNTLLEAMACGCFPVAGDLESIREWIEDGVNGLLVNADDPEELARSVVRAISGDELRAQAAERNLRLIAERATYLKVMAKAEAFYIKMAG